MVKSQGYFYLFYSDIYCILSGCWDPRQQIAASAAAAFIYIQFIPLKPFFFLFIIIIIIIFIVVRGLSSLTSLSGVSASGCARTLCLSMRTYAY